VRRYLVVSVVAAVLVVAPATTASAHPLGNFTVNHYDGLTLHSGSVDDLAVVDTAEIPTAQARPDVDRDQDGTVTVTERARYARHTCSALAARLTLTLDGAPASFEVRSSTFAYRPGAAGLRTSRLECRLSADADLHRRRTLAFADLYQSGRVGWHEISAAGDGVRIDRSPVPQRTVSDQLRRYPNDLLTSPLDVRSAVLQTLPGAGASTVIADVARVPGAGPVSRALAGLNTRFNGLVGAAHLSLGVGLLAVLLSVVLGASHAALPGHGKTVMAAYLAAKRGSVRDAVTVGATVTLTHTAGVLALGLALSVSASLAGEALLRWMGVASGLLVAGIGVGLLNSAVRQRRLMALHAMPQDGRPSASPRSLAMAGVAAAATSVGHSHPDSAAGHLLGPAHAHGAGRPHAFAQPHEHGHHHGPGHMHEHRVRGSSRGGLVAMGIAGGLVPSPSALVVLLAAIGLGRTLFGIGLVIGYGVGMAGTLTVAGLLLVRLGRADSRLQRRAGRLVDKWRNWVPVATACIVLVVGLGLALRGVSQR
jgi:nickel/cobalt exporter